MTAKLYPSAFLKPIAQAGIAPEVVEKFRWDEWTDHPGNPILDPPAGTAVIGEPSIITPADSPDGRWHLFLVSGDSDINHMHSGCESDRKETGQGGERKHADFGVSDFFIARAGMDLVENRNGSAVCKVGDIPTQAPLAGLAFHSELRRTTKSNSRPAESRTNRNSIRSPCQSS